MRISLAFLATVLLVIPPPVLADRADLSGMDLGTNPRSRQAPSGGNNGLRGGSSAGAAAVTRNYHMGENPDLSPQQALFQQNRAIQQYMNLGAQLEAKKQWVNAEKAFNYVLKVSAIRDGVGSPNTIPALQHLVKVTAAQDHYKDAISFAQRVLGFAKNEPSPDPNRVINAQVSLSNLYLANADLENGESAIKEAYDLAQSSPSVSAAKKQMVAHTYGKFLRKLNRESEAERIDPTPSTAGKPAEAETGAKPGDAKTGDTKATETKATDTKTTDTKTADAKTADAKSSDAKAAPPESKPAESKR